MKHYVVIFAILSIFHFKSYAQCGAPFVEEDGIVVIETESQSTLASGWQSKTHFANFTGKSFIQWHGGDKMNTPGIGTMQYKFEIINPGTYQILWRNKVGTGDNSTEYNDSWLKMPDADDFFGEKEGTILRPNGDCTNDCVKGPGKNGWFKVYCSGCLEWSYSTMVNDHDGYPLFATFNSPGVYTLMLSGRSDLHTIDRFVFYHTGLRNYYEATNDGNPETTCAYEPSQPVPVSGVTVSPTNISLVEGQTIQLDAKVEPYLAADKSVNWASSNASVASVNSSGLVTAQAAGNVVITATTADGGYISMANIKIVEITSDCNLLNRGFESNLNNWSVNSGSFNIVSDAAEGSNAVSGDNQSGMEQTINVSIPEGTLVNLSYQSKLPGADATGIVGLDFKNAAGNELLKITRKESPDSYEKFVFSATAPANTAQLTVWVWCARGTVIFDDFCLSIENGNYLATGVTLNESDLTLALGQSQQLVPTVSPSNALDKSVSWTSSDPSIVNVREGIVSGLAEGSATVTVTTNDGGHTATCNVTVSSAPEAVTDVNINEGNQVLSLGQGTTFTATVLPSDATNKSVSWSSSNESIATVNPATGEVTSVAEGTATITVTTADGGFTDSRTVTVEVIHPTGVTIDQGNQNLSIGEQFTYMATVSPSNAYDKSISWSSSNASVASIDPATGIVTAIANGVATITVTTTDGGHVDSRTVTVSVINVTGVSIDQQSQALLEGQSFTFTATVSPANATDKSVSWSSSNESYATVNSSTGEVTAISPGTATITVSTTDGGYTDSRTVTVNPLDVQVTGVSIDQSSPSVEIGKSIGLTATVSPTNASNKNITWSSGNTSIATIDPVTGIVTGQAQGSAVITVTTEDGGFQDNVSVTVTDAGPAACVLLNQGFEEDMANWLTNSSLPGVPAITNDAAVGSKAVTVPGKGGIEQAYNSPVTAGQEVNLTFYAKKANTSNNVIVGLDFKDVNGDDITKYTDNTIGTSYQQYTITANAPAGTEWVNVWIFANDGNTIYADDVCLDVGGTAIVPVESVTLSSSLLNLDVGQTSQLSETVLPANATDKSVIWTSANTAIASVSSSGLVTAVGSGNTTITVTTVDGMKTATCAVEVVKPNVPVTDVNLNKSTLSLVEGNMEQLIETVLPLDATNKSVTWSSSNTSAATVSGGMVSAISAGTTTITVTTVDGSFTASCAVTVSPASIPVTDVTLNKSSLSLVEGNSEQLFETVLPVNASNQNVNWSSSNNSVATVTNGLVQAVSEGTATITVTTVEGSFTTTCAVEVLSSDIPVSSVSLNKSSIDLNISDTEQLYETVLPSSATNKSVSWTSSDNAIASVSDGLVTGLAEGTVTITVTTNDGGFSASCQVNVSELFINVTSVTLNETNITVEHGETFQLQATVNPSNASNKNITWESTQSAVASVTANGLVTATGYGTSSIIVTTEQGNYTALCNVIVPVHVEYIKVFETVFYIEPGQTKYLFHEVQPSNATDKSVVWISNNTDVATVDSNGFVTGHTLGHATLTVITMDRGISETFEIHVVESLVVNASAENKEPEIFPIPFTSNLTIKGLSSNTIFNLTSLDGRLIDSFYAKSDNITLCLSSLEPGIYLIQFKDRKYKNRIIVKQ